MAAPLAGAAAARRRAAAAGIDVQPDLTVAGFPDVYALGDFANIPSGDEILPQLGSVAQQSGGWAGRTSPPASRATAAQPFHYRDKGIMAMIGRKAAVAEIGAHRHELHGRFAFAAWLGRARRSCWATPGAELKAFLSWAEEFYLRPHHRSAELLDPLHVSTRPASTGNRRADR